jgi:hypothetical protein
VVGVVVVVVVVAISVVMGGVADVAVGVAVGCVGSIQSYTGTTNCLGPNSISTSPNKHIVK